MLIAESPVQVKNVNWAVADAPTVSGASSLLEQIGNTPLLDLSDFAHRLGAPAGVGVYAKAEWMNPSGSVKARAALRIVEDAERSGKLSPGKVLIDSSSGNTGIAYALIGALKGFDVHLVMPSNVTRERKALVKAYGATLIESDALEGSDGAIRLVRKLVAEHPERYFYADQYNNDANWQAHYTSTGPEIWQQSDGRITHFVAGLGTTGTFVGTGRYLKERKPSVQLIAVQPEDELSVIEGLKHLPTAITPGIYDDKLADEQLPAAAEATWEMTRRLSTQAGLLVGFSSGVTKCLWFINSCTR